MLRSTDQFKRMVRCMLTSLASSNANQPQSPKNAMPSSHRRASGRRTRWRPIETVDHGNVCSARLTDQ